ncbi:MAG: low affinity iron permease family protein [Deltaproteobacteria bacterium]|nr:low affinity iron permease family protein [Deltaproteobacteria bacterium]
MTHHPHRPTSRMGRLMERISRDVTHWTGSSWAFAFAALIIVVFLIQRAQNKDAMAIQLKLNEIVAAIEGASNRLIDVEALSENELKTLSKHYRQLVQMAKQDIDLTRSHSVEEATARHFRKAKRDV